MENNVILIVGPIVFLLFLLFSMLKIVPEYERLVILQLGNYKGTRGPGPVIVIPLLEIAKRVDLREHFLDIPAQTAITRDNAPIAIDFLVYYRIVEPELSVLKVDDVVRASTNIATTNLRAVIGDIDLDDVLSKREQINDTLRVKLDETTERWGVKITTVEIREIEPPREVQAAMNRQMSAERERRAAVTEANGQREAAIAVAEGEKQAAILRAQGAKEGAILEAQGEREAQLLKAQGYAASLAAIYEKAKDIDEKTMALQYLDMLETVGKSEATKFVLPMELTSMVQKVTAVMTGNSDALQPSNGASSKEEHKL